MEPNKSIRYIRSGETNVVDTANKRIVAKCITEADACNIISALNWFESRVQEIIHSDI